MWVFGICRLVSVDFRWGREGTTERKRGSIEPSDGDRCIKEKGESSTAMISLKSARYGVSTIVAFPFFLFSGEQTETSDI